MNARIEWIDEPLQVLGRADPSVRAFGHLGAITWMDKDNPDESLRTFQAAVNRILDKCGYYPIEADGVLGKYTCGGYAILGDLKNRGCIDPADWETISTDVAAEVTANCQTFTFPTRKGQAQPDKPTSTLTPEELALPWGVQDDRTTQVQRDLNNDLDGHDYKSIPVSGQLDAKTCGAMRLASNEWGMDYMNAFGLNCQAFQAPEKKTPTGGGPVPTCAADEKLNPATGQCEKISCPDGQVFDPDKGECVRPITASTKTKKKTPWGLFLLGAAAVAGIYYGVA